jgi:predicted Zn-dependent protease
MSRNSISTVLGLLLIVPVSVWFASAPLKKDAAFRNGIESGDGEKIISIANSWPHNSGLSLQAAHILKDNNYPQLAEYVLKESLKRNKNDYYVWNLLLQVSSDEDNMKNIQLNLIRLNPLNHESSALIP